MIYGSSNLSRIAVKLNISFLIGVVVSLFLAPLFGILPFLIINLLGFLVMAFHLTLIQKGIMR